MTHDDRSLERAARMWIEAGPTHAPDRAVEAALLRIQTTPQERDLRIRRTFPRRFSNRLAIAAAAMLVVIVGAVEFNRFASVGQAPPTPTRTPSASFTTPPSPTALDLSAAYTNLPGWIVFEHFGQAPDGSTPEFNDDYRTIWLVHADGTGLHELAPGKPSDGKSSPDISPDGKNVIFSSWLPTSSLYEVPISGGDPRKLATPCPAAACAASDPAYSADGSKIAFIRREPGSKSTTSVVVVLDRASGTLTVLEGTRVNETEAFLTQPSWSPDGTRIVYTRNIQTATEEHITDARLFVANIDGSATVALPQPADAPGPWAADADWSPDGSSIVFSTKPNRESEGWGGPSPSIYTVAPDGSNLKPVCTSCLDGGIAPSWTPDGKHILFWGFRSWALMDPDGSEMAHINQAKLTWFGGTLGFGYAAFLQPTP